MKKRYITILITLLMLVSAVGLYYLFISGEDVPLKKQEFTFEYGEIVKLEGNQVLDTDNTSILDTFKLDDTNLKFVKKHKYPNVGTYTMQVTYRVQGFDKKQTIKIIVKDMTKPVFVASVDTIEIEKSDDVHRLSEYFKAKDLSPFELTINTDKIDVDCQHYFGQFFREQILYMRLE